MSSLETFNDRLRAARNTSNAIAWGSFKIGVAILALILFISLILYVL
jgi:hypothetical protein